MRIEPEADRGDVPQASAAPRLHSLPTGPRGSTAEPYIVFGSPSIGDEEVARVAETLRSGWLGTGPRVEEFEQRIAELVGAKHAVAVSSCTAALHLAMETSGVGPGDEVVTTPLTFAATANAIIHCGATPVFADIERETMNIDPAEIERVLTARTRVILPVHFAGRPCAMDSIEELARAHGLLVIEDAAHALEASYHGRKVGSISPLTCFSFYVTKNITTAEGGMVCTDDTAFAERLKVLALHGMSADAWSRFSDQGYKHYEVVAPGYKYNMTDIQATLGLCQLERVHAWLVRREELWRRYDEAFADLPCQVPPKPAANSVHARHLYTLLLDLDHAPVTRDEFLQRMHERGIGTGVHYRALHLHQYYRDRFGFAPEDFPNAKWISDRTLSLPLSAKLTEREADRIIAAVREILGAA